MLYYIIRPLTYLGLLFFCKRIYLSNAQSIPKDRPVILACNHPTAFLEPCIIASFTKRPLYFLVRGDFFTHPFYKKLMFRLHLIPIYRRTHANFRELKQNLDLMDTVAYKLNENIVLMILVEGSASIKKGLRPIQKGVARLAFDVYEKYGRTDVEIIPVGANFDDPTRFRVTPMINFGKSIALKDYAERYKENKNRAIKDLLENVHAGMRKNIIHIEVESDEILVEQQLILHRNEQVSTRFPIVCRTSKRLKKEIEIVEKINRMPSKEKQVLKQKTKLYFEILKQKKIKDQALFEKVKWWRIPIFIFGMPFFLLGAIFNFLPPCLGNSIAQRKVKRIQYLMPVAWGIGNLSYFLYLLLLLLFAGFLKSWAAVLFVMSLPLLAYFSVVYYEEFNAWRAKRQWEKPTASEREQLRNLRQAATLWRTSGIAIRSRPNIQIER
ncbi:MAG: 1-acyl-sn-glycerol-3-phosphate acyltransferase [Bacteroidota bacterium]